MELPFWKIIMLLSFISAFFILLWLFKKAIRSITPEYALNIWWFFAVFWPLLCLVFVGIILYQSAQGMKERAIDAVFTIIPLVFFAIGMTMRRRLLKERRYATVLTRAVVVSIRIRTHSGKRNYFPEFEFRAGERTYRVSYSGGYSFCAVQEGKQVDLYYAPENPELFYVPVMQKHDNRLSILLCGVGIVYPWLGLFAPQFRQLFSFLE